NSFHANPRTMRPTTTPAATFFLSINFSLLDGSSGSLLRDPDRSSFFLNKPFRGDSSRSGDGDHPSGVCSLGPLSLLGMVNLSEGVSSSSSSLNLPEIV